MATFVKKQLITIITRLIPNIELYGSIFFIVYPQCWLQPKLEARFVVHLAIFKYAFYQLKKLKFR
jgi:hypothetical protein